MNHNKNIDRLFREKFRDFEQEPPPYIWDNIQARLDGKRKRRMTPWWWASAVAAGLTLLIGINYYRSVPDTAPVRPVVTGEQLPVSPVARRDMNKSSLSPGISDKISTPGQPSTTRSIARKPTHSLIPVSRYEDANITPDTRSTPRHIAMAVTYAEATPLENPLPGRYSSPDTISYPGFAFTTDDISAEAETLTTVEMPVSASADGQDSGEWAVSTLLSPTYMDYFNKGLSNIDPRFNDNEKHGIISRSYGVQVEYKPSGRLSFESGVIKADYAFATDNIYVSPTGRTPQYSGIIYDSGSHHIELNAVPNSSQEEGFSSSGEEYEGSIIQSFSYFEIPLSAKYALTEGNITLSAKGGVSTLLLDQNEVYVQTGYFTNKIGKSALNKLNFSANVGMELDSKIYNKVHLSVNPVIKFYSRTYMKAYPYNNPFSIGLYSGLKYKF